MLTEPAAKGQSMSRYLLTREVAAALRMSENGVRDLVAAGRLKAHRVRPKGRLLFLPEDVERALKAAGPDIDARDDRQSQREA
jgi:excisionase family DNA binding protein